MATLSSILAWRIPWTEEPGRLQQWDTRVRHNLATKSPPLHKLQEKKDLRADQNIKTKQRNKKTVYQYLLIDMYIIIFKASTFCLQLYFIYSRNAQL